MLKRITRTLKSAINGGLAYIMTGSILTKAITMISSIVLVRLVSKELYAYYSYATNLYGYIEMFNGLELSGALLVVCSKSDSKEKGGAYLRFCTKIAAVIQLFLCIGLCILVSCVSIAYPEARPYIYLYLPIPVASVIIQNIQSYNRAYQQNKRYSLMGVVRAAAITLFAVILVPFIGVSGMIVARMIACAIVIYIGGAFCYRNLKGVRKIELSAVEKKKLFILSSSMLVASFFSYLMPLNETYLVNTLIRDTTVTANFKVAGLIPQQLQLIAGGICVYVYPIIARIKNYKEAWKKIVKIGVYNAAAVIGIALIGILLTPFIILVLYGKQYMDSIALSRALWIMRMVNCAFRTVPCTLLPALGDTKFNFIASPVICVIHVVIDYFMIKSFGIAGVAYATIIVYALCAVFAWGYLHHYCKVKAELQLEEE